MIENKKKAKLFALIPIVFFSVSGGPYGLEEIVSSCGPINTLLLILLLPIIWTIPETMIVAELSSSYPVKGGYYRWVQMGMGRFWGFMEGWWSILYTLIDLSLYPILFTAYLKYFFPEINFYILYSIQLVMIWSSAILNILGIRIVGNILVLFQGIILFFFLLFIYWGVKHISFDFIGDINTSPNINLNSFLFGLSLAFWNFIGWDNGSTVLHEMENPKADYHRALFICIPIIVLFYFFPILIGVSVHKDWSNWQFGEFSFIANSMNHPNLAILIAIGGMITCMGLFNSMLLSSTRIFSTMSEDKLLPQILSRHHEKFHTPYVSIIFAACVYSILVLFSFENLIIYDVVLYLLAILLEGLSLVMLRKMNPTIHARFKIPFGKIGLYLCVGLVFLVVLAILFINFFNFHSPFKSPFTCLLLLISGVPVYLWHEKVCLKKGV